MRRHARALLAGALLALPACHDPVTEIVVVVDTDLSVPGEVVQLQLELDTPAGVTRRLFDLQAPGAAFPATVGLLPGDAAGYGPFAVSVSLFARASGGTPPLVASRKASGVRFVRGSVRMLYLGLPRACACQGTSCPNALAPACADVTDPTLVPFDPAHLPRVTPADGGTTTDGGGAGSSGGGDAAPDAASDAARDTAPDVATEGAAERPSEAGADLASTDGPRDAAAEAPPAKLPRGHACGPGDVCQDGFCVDGVCCQSACTCGSCASTPGFCILAAAGTDPRGDCGAYACNGAGACETSCAETFGACSSQCGSAAHCDGAGKCVPSTFEAGFFCVVGSCMCKPPLTCPAPDGGGAGVCR